MTAKRGPKPKPIRTCAAGGCERRAWKDNPYCPRCTMRARRHGDPGIVLTAGRKKRAA